MAVATSSSSGSFRARIATCYILVPTLIAVLNTLRGTIYAPSMPFVDRLLLFWPAAIVGWIIAGITSAVIIARFDAKRRIATTVAEVIGVSSQ